MSIGRNIELPEALKTIRTRLLFVVRPDVKATVVVGATPEAFRRVGIVQGGTFEGDRLSGEVLDGGNDWQTIRDDGATTLDVRLVLRTTDGVLIAMTYQGIRHGPPELMARVDKGEPVDPAQYYFRINPRFETASPEYGWLNRVFAIGAGYRLPNGPVYSVFEVL
ncbi:MAG: DUF3237 domain-containing protein [Rhizomicrobium sp.]